MSGNKYEIIKEVYNNFFGSMKDTFKDAKKKDPSITLNDVKKLPKVYFFGAREQQRHESHSRSIKNGMREKVSLASRREAHFASDCLEFV